MRSVSKSNLWCPVFLKPSEPTDYGLGDYGRDGQFAIHVVNILLRSLDLFRQMVVDTWPLEAKTTFAQHAATIAALANRTVAGDLDSMETLDKYSAFQTGRGGLERRVKQS